MPDMLTMIVFCHGFLEEVPDMSAFVTASPEEMPHILTIIVFCHSFPEEVPDMLTMIGFCHSLSGRSA